jgi:hypothetical protein
LDFRPEGSLYRFLNSLSVRSVALSAVARPAQELQLQALVSAAPVSRIDRIFVQVRFPKLASTVVASPTLIVVQQVLSDRSGPIGGGEVSSCFDLHLAYI